MKNKMKLFRFLLLAVCAASLIACDPLDPEDKPTKKEQEMVKTEMTWELDSMLVYVNPVGEEPYSEMLYPSDGIDIWSFTFYPCTYHFPKDLCFVSEWTGETIYLAKEYKQDYCKYICTYEGQVISAGYIGYYNEYFMFNGLKEGGWVDVMIREADTNWDVKVWTVSYDVVVEDDGTVRERCTEYYSRR